MHEKSPSLSATKRERLGSRYSKRVRDAGGLPAIVYGHGEEPVPVTLDGHSTLRHIMGGEKIFKMSLQGGFTDQIVLLKDLQFDHLGTAIVHADFARVDLNERVRSRVHIQIRGDAIGLKQVGAIMMHPTSELEIECRVVDLPDYIEVRVDELDVGHAITAGDVKLPSEDMKLITDTHAMVAQIIIQQEIKVGEETEAGATAEPEVLTAKKPADGEAAKPGAAGAKPAAGAKAPAAGAKPAAGVKPAAGAKPAGDKKK